MINNKNQIVTHIIFGTLLLLTMIATNDETTVLIGVIFGVVWVTCANMAQIKDEV